MNFRNGAGSGDCPASVFERNEQLHPAGEEEEQREENLERPQHLVRPGHVISLSFSGFHRHDERGAAGSTSATVDRPMDAPPRDAI